MDSTNEFWSDWTHDIHGTCNSVICIRPFNLLHTTALVKIILIFVKATFRGHTHLKTDTALFRLWGGEDVSWGPYFEYLTNTFITLFVLCKLVGTEQYGPQKTHCRCTRFWKENAWKLTIYGIIWNILLFWNFVALDKTFSCPEILS